MDFTRFGDTVFRRQQRAIFIYYTNENNGINYTNGQLVSQIETTGVRNGIVGSTLFREGVVYNGDGITRRGRYSYGVAQQSSFGGFQYVATQYGNLKINIIGDNASAYIDDVISPTTAYNMHASNIINTTNNGSLPILSLDYNGLTKHVFQTNGNVSFNNTADMAAILGVKGSGQTSGTTSLLVQNSIGSDSLRVYDDRIVEIPYRIQTPFIRNQSGNLVLSSGNFEIEIQSSNPTNGSGSLRTTGDITTTDNQTKSIINVNNLVSSTSATFNTLNGFAFTSTITQTTGIIRGLFINPTLNASTDFRAIQTTSGGAYINTATPQASACLQADSTTQGFLPPRMTTAQKVTLAATAVAGLMIYDTNLNKLCVYTGAGWETITSI
jgi:hypothetical protein